MSYDHSTRPGMELATLEKYLGEIRLHPPWRRDSDRCCAYYDGNQLDSVTLRSMERLGIPPLITNLIKPTVDVVLGMEAKTRVDWRVQADTDAEQDAAEALSLKLHEAERETQADMACSDAYAGQVKAGLGWVEVSRELDPFKYQFVVQPVHRNEIHWDWAAKRRDLDDARYLVRKQWKDRDILKLVFPKQAELIDQIQRFDRASWDLTVISNPGLARAYDAQFSGRIDQSEWWDAERDRLCLYEVWYRIWVRGHVIKLPDGRVVEVDLKNPRHARAILENMVQPFQATYSKMRLSWWIGPHRIADAPWARNHFPYVPFWGHREDQTGIPYGLIRSMMSPQDEVNARDSKAMWMMSSRRVRVDSDAVADHERTRREIARPDAYVILNSNRKPDSKMEVDDNFELSEQQMKVREERKRAVQDSAGIYQAMLGDAKGSADSGIAIASLVEQGSTTLAEMNDNYRFARRTVGQYLLELVAEDIGPNTQITIGGKGKPRKDVVLNEPAKDPYGETYYENSTQRNLFKVALDDVPSTPAYRMQLLQRVGELTRGLPPQAQAFIAPFIVRASDLPERHEMADMMLKAMGAPVDGNGDPEKAQMQQVIGQLQQALAQAEAALQDKSAMEERKLAIEDRRVAAAEKVADATAEKTKQDAAMAAVQAAMSLATQAATLK